MQPTVILFDVDGTLVTTGGVGRRAIERALEAVGVELAASFSFAGMTDRAIIRRHLEASEGSGSEARIDEVLDGYVDILREEVERAPSDGYRLHAGMLAAIDELERRPRTAVGLGTGNIERGARIKLERVGVAARFAFGGFGSDAEDRAELICVGAERGAERLNVERSACRVVVIGDTPKDIAAARAIGAEAFAVATGSIATEQLRQHEPDHLFADMAAPGALVALLG
jgi:phosphoglycolate phosphatase